MEQGRTPDSTPAPSRRAFFGSAIAAGICQAAGPPIFTVPAAADAALLAMGPVILGLVAAADAASERNGEAEDLLIERVKPFPVSPELRRFASSEAFAEAQERYAGEYAAFQQRKAAARADLGCDALERAFVAADMALLAGTRRLAEMRAATLDGLILKAQMVERGDDEALMKSIVADLLALA